MRARSGLYPQLSASAAYDRSLASEFDGVFDNVATSAATAAEDPAADGGLEDLPFGRANTWRASLSLSQNIYSGGRIGAQHGDRRCRARHGGARRDDARAASCSST